MKPRCDFEVLKIEPDAITIRDQSRGRMSVTNDAEAVVEELVRRQILTEGRRLYYYDSAGDLDEILVRGGRFAGFAPGKGGAA